MKKKINEKEIVRQFLTHFYDITGSIEADNYTLDEFYSDFSAETHKILLKLIKKPKKEEKI